MSLLLTPVFATEDEVVGLRYVDAAVRLHSSSLAAPRCIHDVPLACRCAACDADES